jgi:hypothetical protein
MHLHPEGYAPNVHSWRGRGVVFSSIFFIKKDSLTNVINYYELRVDLEIIAVTALLLSRKAVAIIILTVSIIR